MRGPRAGGMKEASVTGAGSQREGERGRQGPEPAGPG